MEIEVLCKLAGLIELRTEYRNKRDVFGEGFEKTMNGELLNILEDEIEMICNACVHTKCKQKR